MRPLLLLSVIDSNRDIKESDFKAACALEMIHTYSLIHDDLPAMDNDDYRRGKPTNHKVFGEAVAILAGDGLLTRSFELISLMEDVSSETKIQLIRELSQASGAEGMVGGQVADLQAEGKSVSLEELEYIHQHKTGALMSFAVMAGAHLGNVTEDEKAQLRTFSQHLGLLFQIKDDILDVEGDSEEMGKAAGSDEGKNQSTYPRLLEMDGAKRKLPHHSDMAIASLNSIRMDTALLHGFVDYIMNRSN